MAKFDLEKFKSANCGGYHVIESSLSHFDQSISTKNYSLKIPVNGSEYYSTGNVLNKVDPGTFMLVQPGEDVRAVVDAQSPVLGKCIYLDKDDFDRAWAIISNGDVLDQCGTTAAPELYSGKYRMEEDKLGGLLRELMFTKSHHLTDEVYLKLATGLVEQQMGAVEMMKRLQVKKRTTKKEVYDRLMVARMYIYDNYPEDIDLDVIALNSGLSKFHLLRLFKSVFGCTPYQMLTERRLEKARELMALGKYSLEDVAHLSGFNQRRTFTASFKRKFGVSPKSYQKQGAIIE